MRGAGRAILLSAIAFAGACERPRTELVVRVDSEVAWGPGRAVQSVVLSVRRGGSTGALRSARTTTLGELPLTVGVVESQGDTDTPVWIEALGCAEAGGCTPETAVVAQRAVVRFVAGQTLELPMLLASACRGVLCASEERCATGTGQCEAATRAQESVRPIGGGGTLTADAGAAEDSTTDVAPATDVGTADASMSDVGVVDAERVDAGSFDIGVRDIGVIDVGTPDVGTIDIGASDLGGTDGGATDAVASEGGAEPTIVCTTLTGTRTCRGVDGGAPCCIVAATFLPPTCGTQVPIFGCVPN